MSAPLDGVLHVVVVAAHPDDETLGVGGLLADLGPDVTVDVVVATDGEASHPRSPTHTPEQLAARRRAEVDDAVRLLAPHALLHLLGLPDGGLAEPEVRARLVASLVRLVGPDGTRTALLSTYRHDGHPDHEEAARAAASAAWRTDARLLQYPVWWWPWRPGEPLPEERVHRIPLSGAARARKARALAGHVSQVEPLSDQPGDEVLLPQDVLAHFRGPHEVVVEVAPGEESPFDGLHRDDADPWDVRGAWYERRKRALTLAALPHERYGVALEVGCSVGALAADLAARCDRLVAVDEAAEALRRAREAAGVPGRGPGGGGRGQVELTRARLPEEWHVVPEDVELVVVSEVGYFLSPNRLRTLARRVRGTLEGRSRATVLACHWRHEIVGWPLRGDDVHALLEEELGLPRRSCLVEDDVVLTVWSR
ncbi:PIG-L family deacetylase [Ornithinimicrobium pekingense]|uniref:PIG-L family deacetylase n=1 Tax=Ornithinimicrobium pekingense TaxID=384677 RepID=UPI001469F37A|nr:PIG-L family deacetylase [Ornithinimicrobium pekingense]